MYPAGPHLIEPEVDRNLLKNDMGCTDEEVEAFDFEEPRCWFRFTDDRYVGLEDSMAKLADVCRRERPDGIAGYSNGGGAAQLVATSPMMQRHIREYLGPSHGKITIPSIIFGSRHDPMLANAQPMAADLFERCELVIADETRLYANHALPERTECYERIVNFVKGQQR